VAVPDNSDGSHSATSDSVVTKRFEPLITNENVFLMLNPQKRHSKILITTQDFFKLERYKNNNDS